MLLKFLSILLYKIFPYLIFIELLRYLKIFDYYLYCNIFNNGYFQKRIKIRLSKP